MTFLGSRTGKFTERRSTIRHSTVHMTTQQLIVREWVKERQMVTLMGMLQRRTAIEAIPLPTDAASTSRAIPDEVKNFPTPKFRTPKFRAPNKGSSETGPQHGRIQDDPYACFEVDSSGIAIHRSF